MCRVQCGDVARSGKVMPARPAVSRPIIRQSRRVTVGDETRMIPIRPGAVRRWFIWVLLLTLLFAQPLLRLFLYASGTDLHSHIRWCP